MNRLMKNKVVLVTGAGVRLGRAIAESVASDGAMVAVHYCSSTQGAAETVANICAAGGRAIACQADLTVSGQIEPLVTQVEQELGPIDALINSAALFHRAPFLQTTEDVLDRQWAVNARGPYLLTQAVARRMMARKSGDVVNVLDIGGAMAAWRNYSAYCMTKAALAMLTQCLALELAPHIRVNAVAPGAILPPAETSADAINDLRIRIPMQRLGEPSDIASAVRFFLTGPRFITGQILAVDGGRSVDYAFSR